MSDSPQSPPKDVEPGVQATEGDDPDMNDPQDPHGSALAYEFEVKEQDRWLPIANGELQFLFSVSLCCFPVSHGEGEYVVAPKHKRFVR
jgi:hypothetical protein